jgi:hypothetical protein
VSSNHNALGNNRYFDPKMGFLVALIMGTGVFIINYKYGIYPALTATSKQIAYTFFVGGITTRLCENIATRIENDFEAVLIATIIASGTTIILTYLVHSLKGTTNPLESTLPTLFGSPPSMVYWSLRKRRQLKKKTA